MANPSVERMSVGGSSVGELSLPDLPAVPKSLRYRSPEMQEYHEKMQLWWKNTKMKLENVALAVQKESE